MTNLMHGRMRRHTRPAKYISKASRAEAMAFSRPGGSSFSFNGEFPDMGDLHPVEATGRRRSYTTSRGTGNFQVVQQDYTSRTPAVGIHGVHVLAALVMLVALAVCLGSVTLSQMKARDKVQSSINYKLSRIESLNDECYNTERAIASLSSDLNVRQEALRIGLINSRGVNVQYLEAPQDAVITLADHSVIQSLASIWGR